MRTKACLLLLAIAVGGCPKGGESERVRVGVDQTLEDLGLAEYLQAAYEESTKERLQIVYADTTALQSQALAGGLDMAIVVSESSREALAAEGIPIRSDIYAHEELLFIGPFENHLGDHIEGSTAVGLMQAMARANYRYLKGKRGSAERARHDWLFRKSRDRLEPGAFFETKHDGVALVKAAVEANSYALVKRSSLLLAALDGVQPHRIYREGDPQLVLRLALVEVHPAKTKRPRRPGFYDFVFGEEGQKILASFGAERFGYPVYGSKTPADGEGAQLPKLKGDAVR